MLTTTICLAIALLFYHKEIKMDKIKLTKVEDIKTHILCNNLTNIVVETGHDNFFAPNKNKFIVTKYFLKNKYNLRAILQLI